MEDGAGVDVLVTSVMAKEALVRFQSRKYGECLELIHHLLQKKEDDHKVLHNIAIAEFFLDDCSDPKKLLELKHSTKSRKAEQLTRSSLEQAEAASISGTKGTAVSKGSSTSAQQLGVSSNSTILLPDEFDVDVLINEFAELLMLGGENPGEMDFSPFKMDVDDLINEFAENGLTTQTDMKRVWLSRKFSCIYKASPSDDLTLFMQTLYSQSIGYIVGSKSLSHQLGGLYCLYCLHESQPFRPPIRIYISLSELRSLKDLVVSTKQRGIPLVCPLVKRMLEQNMFLFGSVDVNEDSMVERVDKLTGLQNARVEHAYKKLFANTRIEHFLHTNLNEEIDLGSIKKMSTDYLTAKRLAIEEARAVADVQNIEHMATDKNPIGDCLEGIADEWDSQKKAYYQQMGADQIPDGGQLEQRLLEYHPRDEEPTEGDNVDEFEQELEQLLSSS